MELEAAPTLIAQTGADTLLAQLSAGMLTPDEYHQAVALVAPPVEDGPRCLYCSKAAYIGTTCAEHADRAEVERLAHARFPVVEYSRYPTRETFIAAVKLALASGGHHRLAARWTMRAGHAPGMNALHQIASEFPIVLRSGL